METDGEDSYESSINNLDEDMSIDTNGSFNTHSNETEDDDNSAESLNGTVDEASSAEEMESDADQTNQAGEEDELEEEYAPPGVFQTLDELDVQYVDAQSGRNAVYQKLEEFKSTITAPLYVNLTSGNYVPTAQEKASLELRNLLKDNHVTKNTTENIFQWINKYLTELGQGNLCLLSPYKADMLQDRIVPVSPPVSFNKCEAGCYMFSSNQPACPNASCPYRGTRTRKHDQIPLSTQLAGFLSFESNREKLNCKWNRPSTTSSTMESYYDGSNYRNIMETSTIEEEKTTLDLVMYVDGFTPFDHTKVTMTMVMFSILNLAPQQRYKQQNLFVPCVPTGKRKAYDIFTYLIPTIQDLLIIEKQGLVVSVPRQPTLTYKVKVRIMSTDIPGLSDLIRHKGYAGYDGCRICVIPGVYKNGKMRFNHFNEETHLPVHHLERTAESYSVAGVSGIKQPSPLTLLDLLRGPSFWGMDEMHLWGANLGKNVWALVCDNTPGNPLHLPPRYRESVGEAIEVARSLNPTAATTGELKNPASGNERSLDWIDFLVYIAPTLLVDSLDAYHQELMCSNQVARMAVEERNNMSARNDQARTAVSALSRHAALPKSCLSVNLISRSLASKCLQRYFITDLSRIHILYRNVDTWLTFLNDTFGVSAFSMNQHLLTHLELIIRSLGPMRTYSVRALERMIGIVKRDIRSTAKPDVNVFTVICEHHRWSKQQWNDSNIQTTATVTRQISFLYKKHSKQIVDQLFINIPIYNEINSFYVKSTNQTLKLLRGSTYNKAVYCMAQVNNRAMYQEEEVFHRTDLDKRFVLCRLSRMMEIHDNQISMVEEMIPKMLLVKNETAQQKVSLIQIAYEKDVYLFHVKKNGLPIHLRTLIECNDVVKIGRGVKSDLTRLMKDYQLSETTVDKPAYIELAAENHNKGYIDRIRNCSLQSLCEDVFHKHLPKTDGIRKGDWNAEDLSQEQRSYAAIDAYVGKDLYNAMASLPQLNCPVTSPTTPGTCVSLYPSRNTCKGPSLVVGKIVEGDTTGCDKYVMVELVKVYKARFVATICKHGARALDRVKLTFEALQGEPVAIQVDICCLRTTRNDIDKVIPVIDEAEDQSVPTLVLKDAFHLMDSISVSERHGMHKEFMARFRDALFLANEDDKTKVSQVLESNNLT